MRQFLRNLQTKFERTVNLRLVRGHAVWLTPISSGSTVVDLGAHKGDFAQYFVDTYSCKIFGVEPNRMLQQETRQHMRGYIDTLAVTVRDGPIRLNLSANPEASSIHHEIASHFGQNGMAEVRGVTLKTYIKEKNLEHIDLLKIDIEGEELSLLKNLPEEIYALIDQITVEFHDFIAPQTYCEVVKTIAHVESKGFFCLNCNFPYHDNVLFIRKCLLSPSTNWQSFLNMNLAKSFYYLRGIYRKLERPFYSGIEGQFQN